MNKDQLIEKLQNENIELRKRLRDATSISNARITPCTKRSVSAIVVNGNLMDFEKRAILEKLNSSVRLNRITYFFLNPETEVQFLNDNDLRRVGLYRLTDAQKYVLFG
jgi:hypothetical protein